MVAVEDFEEKFASIFLKIPKQSIKDSQYSHVQFFYIGEFRVLSSNSVQCSPAKRYSLNVSTKSCEYNKDDEDIHSLSGIRLKECPEGFYQKGSECVQDCTQPTVLNPAVMKPGTEGACLPLEDGDNIRIDTNMLGEIHLFRFS